MMEEKLFIRRTVILSSIFAVIALLSVLIRVETKNITIVDVVQAQEMQTQDQTAKALRVRKPMAEDAQDALTIPLAKDVSPDDIRVENLYASHELRVYIDGHDPDFFEANPLVSGLSCIEGAEYLLTNEKGGVCLRFGLDGMYENRSDVSDNRLVIRFFKPAQLYAHRIVLDPLPSSVDQGEAGAADPVMDVAMALEKRFASTDVKIYCTRRPGNDTGSVDAISMAEDAQADFLIQIGCVPEDSDRTGLSCDYNNVYFIRQFGNSDLAYLLLQNTAAGADLVAGEMYPIRPDGDADDASRLSALREDLLWNARIPAARIYIGNPQTDAAYLTTKKSLDGIADGLYAGICESFRIREERGQ